MWSKEIAGRSFLPHSIALGLFAYLAHLYIGNPILIDVINNAVIGLSLMFIGICFYNKHAQHWAARRALTQGISLWGGLAVELYVLRCSAIPFAYFVNYTYAAVAFFTVYHFREKLPYSRVLDELANRSYSLYIFHQIPCFVLMACLLQRGMSVGAATAAGFCFAVAASIVLYQFVERPTVGYSKRF